MNWDYKPIALYSMNWDHKLIDLFLTNFTGGIVVYVEIFIKLLGRFVISLY
jgi:hypothetical protein